MKLGLPDRLAAGATTGEQLAEALQLSAPHLIRVLRGLCTIGICEELAGGSFALTQAGQSLTTGSPSRLAEKVQIVVEQYWQPWANLAAIIETGKPAFAQIFGTTVFDWRDRNEEQGALFDSYLAKEAFAQGGPIVEALDCSGVRTIADIGGGYGGLLAAILQAHPNLAGILFDRPHTIEAASSFLGSQGVADRVQRLGGGDAEAAAILRNCRSAMPDGAKLAIIERPLPERATDDPAPIMLDLHMMTITGGRGAWFNS